MALRCELVRVLQKHEDILTRREVPEYSGEVVEPIADHIHRMQKNLEWGSHPFLMAAALFFNAAIEVIQIGGDVSKPRVGITVHPDDLKGNRAFSEPVMGQPDFEV